MMRSNTMKFENSFAFKALYLSTALLFAAMCAVRTARILYPNPGIGMVLVVFVLFGAAFLLVSRFAGKISPETHFSLRLPAAAYMCTYALTLHMEAEKSILWLIVFALWYVFLRSALEKESSSPIRAAALILGILFALFVFFGSQLERYGRLEILYLLNEPAAVFKMLFASAAQALMFAIALNFAFAEILARDFSSPGMGSCFKSAALRVLALAFVIFVCYLPYFCAFYPGCLSPDSLYELEMQLGIKELSNHHPYLHQLVIGLCLRLGGTVEKGVALYSLVQMLLLSFVFGFCVFFLGRMRVNRCIQTAAFCFFAFFPVNAFYSVTMWKDVFYAAVTLGFMMLLVWQGCCVQVKNRLVYTAALVLAAFCFCLFRNNGWYAFLLGFPLYILCNRRNWKSLCAVFAVVVLLVSAYNHIIFDVMGISKSAAGEMLSVPLQQIARTVKNDPEVINDEDAEVLWELFPELDKLGEIYSPHISDPVKSAEVFNSWAFDSDPMKYLASWAKIGLKHPVSYVEAFLLQCYGYWYPDVEYWIIHNDIEENQLGLEMRPESIGTRFEMSMLARDISQSEPTAILFSLGLMVWLMIIAAALLVLKGRGRTASPIFILAGLWLTTLASPVYCEYRYMYSFVVCVPLFLGLAIGLNKAE